MKQTIVICLFCAASGVVIAAQPDILVADFEGPAYGDWTVTGEAFGPGPAHGTLPNQMQVSGFEGQGLVNSYYGGDGSQGALTSPEFTIERAYINFLVGGGAHTGKTCLNLLVDGAAVRTATGFDNERLSAQTWNVEEFKEKRARIEIVDKSTTGWGHINVDRIVQSDARSAEEIDVSVLYHETYRPQFHFTAKKNWLNDPNGLVFYEGEYHLFFQHNPFGIEWGNMHWGHAVSKDLVHWEELPIALAPDEHGTCFSGSAVVDWHNTAGFQTGSEKVLVAIYTGAPVPEVPGGPKFSQCVAYSNDRGRTWTKYAKNPVLDHIVGSNRDPKVFWHAPSNRWVMALYLDKNDYALFGSPDLKSWTRLCDVPVRECSECPDMFALPVDGDPNNVKWLFLAANGNYLIGSFDGTTFNPESGPHQGDYGKNSYATQSYSDTPGRRIQVTWMNGGQYPGMPFNQQMSFPCDLALRAFPEGLRLCRTPVPEIASLYDTTRGWHDIALNPSGNPLDGITGELFDIEADIVLGEASVIRLDVRGTPIAFSVKDAKLTCLDKAAELHPIGGRIALRVLLDRTSLEVYADGGRVSMTSCFLPQPVEKEIAIHAEGGSARIDSMKVHVLKSAWPSPPKEKS